MVNVSQEHIEIVEGASGPKARIAGHRIRVQDVAIWWDHRDEIEAEIAADDAFFEEFRKQYPESPLQEKLRRLRGEERITP